ncbi:MAG: class I SAM-dependent methyltransferase [Nanoarchaeales archaeon]|nr:class I SAM-dependent methyltransferase [Nanoarchaeales archaeon]
MDYLESTKKAYNSNATQYIEKFKLFLDYDTYFEIQNFIKLLKGKNILDIGCGPGFQTKYLTEKGFNTTGIDNSEEMIKQGREIYKNSNIKLLELKNINKLNQTFDGIWAEAVLFHISKQDFKDTINNFNKLLNKEGLLYFSLKQGSEELILEDGRFFAYYKKEEILNSLNSKFELLNYRENKVHKDTFMNFLFKKK